MSGKKKTLLTIIISTALIITGCGTGSGNGTEKGSGSGSASKLSGNVSAAELDTVKIGAGSATAQLTESALVAQNLGYIDEELEAVGYKAEYIGFAGAGPAINEAFAAGEIDYALAYAEFPAITGKSNGVDLKVIGVTNQEQNYALLATDASGIKKAADIVGKKIIVTPGTILYKYFVELCQENNIDYNDVEIVNALTDAQTVLASGEADGLIITYSAALMYGAMGLGTVVADTTSNLEQASGQVVAGRAAFVEAHPEVAKALLRALRRAAEYVQENPDEAYDLMATEASPAEILQQAYAYDTSFKYFSPEFSEAYMERAQKVYDFAKENSLLGGDVDLNELFDSTYVDEVMAE